MHGKRRAVQAAACICAVCCSATLGSAPLAAQQPGRRTVTLAAGPSLYDFGGAAEESRFSGVGLVTAARLDYALTRVVIAEFSVSYFQKTDESGTERSLLPEANVQFAGVWGSIRPYIGVGGGVDVRLTRGTGGTVHGVLGTRVGLAPKWNIRLEARGRVLVPFSAWADVTLGAGRTF